MSRHAATRRPTATTTVVALAVLLASLTASIPAAWYGITGDWAVTGRTILLAVIVLAITLDGFVMAWATRGLLRLRRQP